MPEELDPTTAQLVSELSAQMLPALTKSLSSAVKVDDVVKAIDRSNLISQDLRVQIEKAVRSGVDEGRAGRNVIIQSIRTSLEEISSLRKILEKVPDNLEAALKNNKPDDNNIILQELARISELLNELITGITTFSQTYANDKEQKISELEQKNFEPFSDSQILSENNSKLDKLINSSLPGLEGLVKAHEKTQSYELEQFSREVSALQKQNNLALIHEIKEAVKDELSNSSEKNSGDENELLSKKISFMMKIIIGLSGTCLTFALIIIFMLMFK